MPSDATEEPRRVTSWLLLGVLALPLVFSWFTLRRGYSRDVQVGAFLHLGLAALIALARAAST
jgi:hypothetical protein